MMVFKMYLLSIWLFGVSMSNFWGVNLSSHLPNITLNHELINHPYLKGAGRG